MGFWQGVAKATGEISQERFARQEKEKEREFSREIKKEDRQHDIDLLNRRIKADNDKLIKSLRAKRAADRTASGSSINQFNALATKLQGAEGADEYLATVGKDLRSAEMINETVTDLQEKLGRELTPAEIIQHITPVVTDQGASVMTFDDELEQLMYEDALEEVGKPEPALSVSGSLYNEYSKADVELAEENFTSAMLDLARSDVEELTKAGSPEAADINALISEAEGGNQFAMSKLSNRYGNTVIADFYLSMQENTFLRPIIASGAYGSRIQRFDALVQSYERGELSDEMAKQLQETYPQVFN